MRYIWQQTISGWISFVNSTLVLAVVTVTDTGREASSIFGIVWVGGID